MSPISAEARPQKAHERVSLRLNLGPIELEVLPGRERRLCALEGLPAVADGDGHLIDVVSHCRRLRDADLAIGERQAPRLFKEAIFVQSADRLFQEALLEEPST
jgi:hypothetical protein